MNISTLFFFAILCNSIHFTYIYSFFTHFFFYLHKKNPSILYDENKCTKDINVFMDNF